MTSAETQNYQEQLKLLKFKANKTTKWIADKIHKKEYDVYYAINTGTKIDAAIYCEIKAVLEAEIDNRYDCNNLIGLAFQTATTVTDEIALIFHAVQNATSDNKLTPLEVDILKLQINSTQKEINEKLNDLKKILEGK